MRKNSADSEPNRRRHFFRPCLTNIGEIDQNFIVQNAIDITGVDTWLVIDRSSDSAISKCETEAPCVLAERSAVELRPFE